MKQTITDIKRYALARLEYHGELIVQKGSYADAVLLSLLPDGVCTVKDRGDTYVIYQAKEQTT